MILNWDVHRSEQPLWRPDQVYVTPGIPGVMQPFKLHGGAQQNYQERLYKTLEYFKSLFGEEIAPVLKWAKYQEKEKADAHKAAVAKVHSPKKNHTVC